MIPPCSAEEFLFNKRLLHLRSRGIGFHPHLPDDCPLDFRGAPTFSWSINHLLPDQTDKTAILKFMGLNPSTIKEVLDLYAQDTEPHTNHGEAVHNGFEYTFPLANRLWQLYSERNVSEGSYYYSYGTTYPYPSLFHFIPLTGIYIDGYIIAGIDIAGLSPEFAIWCGLSADDPRYDESLMSSWYEMTPMQYALEIVASNTCRLNDLWAGRISAGQHQRPPSNAEKEANEALA
jgi:hypothetical protein